MSQSVSVNSEKGGVCSDCDHWDTDSIQRRGDEYLDHRVCEFAHDLNEDHGSVVPLAMIYGGHEYYGAALLTHRTHGCHAWKEKASRQQSTKEAI